MSIQEDNFSDLSSNFQIDLPSLRHKNSELCVFLYKHELLQHQPDTPTHARTHRTERSRCMEKKHLYRIIGKMSLSVHLLPRAILHNLQSDNTTPSTALLPQSVLLDVRRQGRE